MQTLQQKQQLIKQSVITIPDYPHAGILFRDITGILANAEAFQATIELFTEHYQHQQIDKVVGTEARGFIFAAPLALALKAGFVPVRKPNKLPRDVYSQSYQLEYGEDQLQIHTDAIKPGEKVLIVDDLLATGGTVAATAQLVQRCGGEVIEAAFVINLVDLGGEQKLAEAGVKSYSLIEYAGL